MTKRPPLLGYNHNVRHAGRLFHVQSEDSGVTRLALTTHVFFEGTILGTIRSTYTADMTDAVVQKQMQDQHKTMLKRVRDGEFDKLPEVQAHAKAGKVVPSSGDDASGVWVSSGPHGPAKEALPDPAASTLRTQLASLKVADASAAAPAKAAAPVKPTAKNRDSAVSTATADKTEKTAEKFPEKPAEKVADAKAGEVSRPGSMPTPPPLPAPGSLAARLRLSPATATPGPIPPPVAPVAAPPVAAAPAKPAEPDDEPAPVLEFEADLPDDEPSISIDMEAPEPDRAESAATEDVLLSQSTPLPVARPLASLRDNSVPGVPNTQFAVSPPPPAWTAPPANRPPAPPPPPRTAARATATLNRPLLNRPLHTGLLRARPTAEGVTMLRGACASTRPTVRPSSDGHRITLVLSNPTTPAPQAQLAAPTPEDERSLDTTVLAYLMREQHQARR